MNKQIMNKQIKLIIISFTSYYSPFADSHLSLHDIVRSSQLADKDIELTQKIRDECGWWEKADYMNEPIDWSNREQVHTRVRESGGITWNKDRNKQQQYKRVVR